MDLLIFYFSAIYKDTIPKVSGICLHLLNPISLSLFKNIFLVGNALTELVKYLYAFLSLDIILPNKGKMYVK